ncbi:MAG: tryptophan synthase subunit alpha [Candidatus Altiarchaeales archaeon A3]|nr:MAG: tryptophan synthase subunit alpha [Candidatus Altiarchaeales archaeon A3]
MKISEKFKEIKEKEGRCALIAYVCAGDPNFEKSKEIVRILKNYADIIELGLPFSDPIADGPTIQQASERALKSGMNTDVYFKFCCEVKDESIPLVCMTYYNLLYHYGLEKFVLQCSVNGIKGIIIPDLPVEESDELLNLCAQHDIDLIFLIAQTSTKERIKKISEKAGGFLYLISVLGVTGARENLNIEPKFIEDVRTVLKDIKKEIPLALGFGISNANHINAIKDKVDGVIVGSAIINKTGDLKGMENFVGEMRKATEK